MVYLLAATAILFVIEVIYFRVAGHFNIIDKPNRRSSHKQITLRGGGIVFTVGALIYFVSEGFDAPWFSLGLLLLSVVSFMDDVRPVKAKTRFVVQTLSVLLMLYELSFSQLPWYWWIIATIVITGILNAWNFMDGINGITAGISIITVGSLYYLNSSLHLFDVRFFYWIIAALLVFGFFNGRPVAKCFAGDIGSIGIAYIILFMLTKLLLATKNPAYLLLLTVYGVDAVLTIIQRIKKKENIFLPHRQHLYQYLANEFKWSHLRVSTLYVAIQLSINLVLAAMIHAGLSLRTMCLISLMIVGALVILYTIVKKKLKAKILTN